MIYREKYKIRCSEIDQNQLLTVPALLQIMQEASLQHTLDLGVSYWDLEQHKVSWVLLKKELHILKHAKLNDIVEVFTSPSGFDRFFAQRDYQCVNDVGECIAYANSQWALINTDTRKISPLLPYILDLPVQRLNDNSGCNFRLRETGELTSCLEFQVSIFDLDWNQHLNNSNLVKFILSALIDHSVDKFQVQFISEATLNDRIVISKKEFDNRVLLKAFNQTKNKITALALASSPCLNSDIFS